MKETLFKQLNTYSNSLVSFSVIQGLVYVYFFGSNQTFNCIMKSSYLLSEFTVFMFIVASTLSTIFIVYLSKNMIELCPEFEKIIVKTARGKITIVILSGLTFGTVTLFYGALVEVPAVCKQIIS